MTTLSIQPPFPIFSDRDGSPLENGYIWVGTANLNPITNPVAVYWDAGLTQPAVLPVRTINGYPANSGTPGRLYVSNNFSITVQDANGSLVYSAPAVTDRYNDVVTQNIRRETYLKAIGAGATNIFTFSMTGSPVSGFVTLRMFGNDSAFPNGAIYQEVVFTFHQDGAYYQNSSIVNSTQAGNGLTTLPTYAIVNAAGVWTVSMTPGASGAIGNVTFIAEVLGVGSTAISFAYV